MQGAIFDVDGTLIDSGDIWYNLATIYLKKHGIKAQETLEDEVFTFNIPETAEHMIELYKLSKTKQEIISDLVGYVYDYYKNEVPLREGAREFLEILRQEKIPMIVVSSLNQELIEIAFDRLGIRSWFCDILSSEIYGSKKDTYIYELAAKKLGVLENSKIYVFEDACYAVVTAKKLNMKTIGIFDERAMGNIKDESDFFFENWKEIKDWYLNKKRP